MVAVRRFEDGDATAVAAIVEGLPDYFTSDVPEKAPRDAERHDAWVLTSAGASASAEADAVTGFAVVARKSAGGAEILWIAVEAGRRGHGHGTMLLGHVLDDLAASGISVVEAKTLDRSSGYRPYEPPGPSGNATASSTSTPSTRCRTGSPATPPPSTWPPSARPAEEARPAQDARPAGKRPHP